MGTQYARIVAMAVYLGTFFGRKNSCKRFQEIGHSRIVCNRHSKMFDFVLLLETSIQSISNLPHLLIEYGPIFVPLSMVTNVVDTAHASADR